MVSGSEKSKPSVAALKIDPELRKHSSNNSNKPAILIIAAVAAVFAIIVLAIILKGRLVEVKTTAVQKYQQAQGLTVLNASGYVEPRRRATVAAKITGQVVEMLVEEGIKVAKGQVLARLDDSEARARFNASKADLDVARARIPELKVSLADAERNLSRISD